MRSFGSSAAEGVQTDTRKSAPDSENRGRYIC